MEKTSGNPATGNHFSSPKMNHVDALLKRRNAIVKSEGEVRMCKTCTNYDNGRNGEKIIDAKMCCMCIDAQVAELVRSTAPGEIPPAPLESTVKGYSLMPRPAPRPAPKPAPNPIVNHLYENVVVEINYTKCGKAYTPIGEKELTARATAQGYERVEKNGVERWVKGDNIALLMGALEDSVINKRHVPKSDIVNEADSPYIYLPKKYFRTLQGRVCTICGKVHYKAVNVKKEDEPIIAVPEKGTDGRCFKCGAGDHVANNCPANEDQNSPHDGADKGFSHDDKLETTSGYGGV